MTVVVITACAGAALRQHAEQFRGRDDVLIFPEAGLDANEQAAIIKGLPERITTIVTLSPWIVSDASRVVVIDGPEVEIPFGSSVNKVTMRLWRGMTIGDLACDRVAMFRESAGDDVIIGRVYSELGDSIERHLLLHALQSRHNERATPGA